MMHTTRTTPKIPVRSGSRSRRRVLLVDKSAPAFARINLATQWEKDVASGRAVDLQRHRAEVNVEVRTVGTERRQPEVVLAELLDVVVHLGQSIDELARERAEVLQGALQRSTGVFQ